MALWLPHIFMALLSTHSYDLSLKICIVDRGDAMSIKENLRHSIASGKEGADNDRSLDSLRHGNNNSFCFLSLSLLFVTYLLF